MQGGGETVDVRRGPCVSSHTIGWQSGCSCDAGEPTPTTVLDVFAGAGTTLLIAAQMHHHAIGIELNPDYCEMAWKRIATAWTAVPAAERRQGQMSLLV